MPCTIRGVYHNLKESKYTVSNGEIVYFFSSEFMMNKFLEGYQSFREQYLKRLQRLDKGIPLNMGILADIQYYKKVERRGFRVTLKMVEMKEDELYQYALRKMTQDKPVKWYKVINPRTLERLNLNTV